MKEKEEEWKKLLLKPPERPIFSTYLRAVDGEPIYRGFHELVTADGRIVRLTEYGYVVRRRSPY